MLSRRVTSWGPVVFLPALALACGNDVGPGPDGAGAQTGTGATSGSGGAFGSGGIGAAASGGGLASGGGGTSAGGADASGGSGGLPSGGTASGGAGAGGAGATGAGGGSGGAVSDVDKYFGDWPAGSEPLSVGQKAAEVFLAQSLTLQPGSGGTTDPNDDYKHYRDACAWYGALSVAALLGNATLTDGLIAKYEPYKGTWGDFDPPTNANSYQGHVDNNVFGIVPLEIAKLDSDPIYFQEGDLPADHQATFIQPQIRYAIDDMFMITSLQIQAYRSIHDDEVHRMRHLDTAAETMVDYLDTMQEPDGLFPHHRDDPAFRISWGRGNGWYAAGMAEIIRDLPQTHKDYAAINEGYQAMMNGLLQYQIPQGQEGAGLWKQVVDSDDARNWAETSGSAMFAYAIITGVRRGWLDVETFGPVARNAWLGLVSKFGSDGRIQDTSMWAYKPDSHSSEPGYVAGKYNGDEENYYFERPKVTGDNHGQAPLMWAAAALARPLN